MKRLYFILAALIVICLGIAPFSHVSAASQRETPAISASHAWLSLIDGGDYAASWGEASTYFRGAVTEQNWVASLHAVRKPLGKVVRRALTKKQEATTLPGAPDGKYVVLSFKTAFGQKKSAVETVTLMLDDDGKWRAAGYFIR